MEQMKSENTIACCFLTHNHPDIVRDILTRSLSDYAARGIDLHFFDDSSDGKTKNLIDMRRKTAMTS